MKPKEYYKKAASEWLKRAEEDIHWTEHNIKASFFTQACFTAQQVAEKSLKAFLRYKGKEIDREFKTHKLTKLLKICKKYDKKFSYLEKDCKVLNQYYAPTRYPEILGLDFSGYTKKEAEEALKLSKKIYNFVKQKLKI